MAKTSTNDAAPRKLTAKQKELRQWAEESANWESRATACLQFFMDPASSAVYSAELNPSPVLKGCACFTVCQYDENDTRRGPLDWITRTDLYLTRPSDEVSPDKRRDALFGLQYLESVVVDEQIKREETSRVNQLKRAAWAKVEAALTKEEIQLLGLGALI